MRGFGYLSHRSAICAACGKRLPGAGDPVIVWGHSLDGRSYASYCEPCASRFRVKVVERVVVGDEWRLPEPPHLCADCGRELPAPDDGGWVLWALTSDGLASFCNDCRLSGGLQTATASRPKTSDQASHPDR